MEKSPSFTVAIVGATGAAGQELLPLLHERKFPMSSLRLFASWTGASLLVSDQLDSYRLKPGHDYGGGLRGNSLGYPGPEFVRDKAYRVLNVLGVAPSKARILMLGVSYKRDLGDWRESPALDVIKLLLAKGAETNPQLSSGLRVRTKLDRGTDTVLTTGTTPLLRAAKAGDVAAVRLLLEKGADAKLATKAGINPLNSSRAHRSDPLRARNSSGP